MKKKKKRKGLIAPKILFILILVCICGWTYMKFNPMVKTKVVYSSVAEDVISAKGISVFDEELLQSPSKGAYIINYSDGTRVLAKTHVATVYSGGVDPGKSLQIQELSEKINYLETNIKNHQDSKKNTETLNSSLISKMKNISAYAVDGTLESIQREAQEIESIITTNNDADLETQINSLKNQREDVERSITGTKYPYISKTAGEIYSGTDGYETTITPKVMENINVDVFNNLWNGKKVDYEKSVNNYVFGKIINNYEVNILTLIDAKNMEGIKEGSSLYIRLSSHSKSQIAATVSKMTQPQNGKCILILSVTNDVETLMSERKFEFEIIKRKYKGLLVDKNAIFQEGGKSMVYVIKDSIVRKREIDILHQDAQNALVREDNSNEKNLLLYDLVITKSKNATEGMIISDYR